MQKQIWNNIQTLLGKRFMFKPMEIKYQIFLFRSDNRTYRRYSSMCCHVTYTVKHRTENERRW